MHCYCVHMLIRSVLRSGLDGDEISLAVKSIADHLPKVFFRKIIQLFLDS